MVLWVFVQQLLPSFIHLISTILLLLVFTYQVLSALWASLLLYLYLSSHGSYASTFLLSCCCSFYDVYSRYFLLHNYLGSQGYPFYCLSRNYADQLVFTVILSS